MIFFASRYAGLMIVFSFSNVISTAIAFDLTQGQPKLPLQIEASQGINCDQNHNKCVASDRVKVTYGSVVMTTDQLTVFFADEPRSASPSPTANTSAFGQQKMIRLEARGHVVLWSTAKQQRLEADEANYDFEQSQADFKGQALQLKTDQITVTAKESFQYFEKQRLVLVNGDAVATQGENTIQADCLQAVLTPSTNDTSQLERLLARGHVIVKTPQGRAEGQEGEYVQSTQILHLNHQVKISYHKAQNALQLNGERAEIDLKTGRSRLLTNPTTVSSSPQVKVLFTPHQP